MTTRRADPLVAEGPGEERDAASRPSLTRRLLPAPSSRGRGRAHRVFHPLVGADLRTLGTALSRNGVAPRRIHVAAVALSMALLRLPFTAAEAAALQLYLRRERSLPAPVFIIGHWRSGTTHLANTLSRSGAFGILPPISVGLPWEALGLARLVAPFILQFFPRNRLIDDVALASDLPQEDELALANMTGLSFYHGVYFPREIEAAFDRGLFFDQCSEGEVAVWTRALRLYVAKMTLHQGGRPLLIRNPAHSARIPLLRALWPDAKFIHIHRNPYTVHASSRRMFTTLLRELALQDAAVDTDELVLRTYPRLMDGLLDGAASLPRGSFAEVRFESFQRSPLSELERVHHELDLPGFIEAQERFARYLGSIRDYRGAVHRLRAADLAQVRDRWAPFLERWEYGVPGEG